MEFSDTSAEDTLSEEGGCNWYFLSNQPMAAG